MEKLAIHVRKNEVRFLPHTIYKNELKIDLKKKKDLNVRAKTIKIPGRNIGVNIHILGLGNSFFDMTSKSTSNKN